MASELLFLITGRLGNYAKNYLQINAKILLLSFEHNMNNVQRKKVATVNQHDSFLKGVR